MKIHYQAPPAAQLENEMRIFIDWFDLEQGNDLVLKSAIAHLWFVTLHPFEDGNGGIKLFEVGKNRETLSRHSIERHTEFNRNKHKSQSNLHMI